MGLKRTIQAAARKILGVEERSFGDQRFFMEALRINDGTTVTDPYSQHAWAYAGIRAIAKAVGQAPLVAYSGDSKAPKPLSDTDPLALFLDNPNPLLSTSQLLEATVVYQLAHDGALWVLMGRTGLRKETEYPVEAWPYKLEEFTPLDEKGAPIVDWTKRIAYWKCGSVTLEAHQVCVFRLFNPANPLGSLSPLDPAKAALDAGYAAENYNAAFFKNDARPGGILKYPGSMSEAQLQQFRQGWTQAHEGPMKRGKTGILQNGVEFVETGTTQKDMDYVEGLRWSRDEVLAALGVPKAVLSITDDLNYATHLGQARIFWENTVIPWMKDFEGVLWSQVLKPINPNKWVAFDTSGVGALQSDFGERLGQANQLVLMGYDLDTANERLKLGMPKAPILDDNLMAALKSMSGSDEPRSFNVTRSLSFVTDKRAWLNQHIRAWMFPLEARFSQTVRRYLKALNADQRARLEAWIKSAGASIDDVATLTQEDIDSILFSRKRWDAVLKKTFDPEFDRVIKAASRELAQEMSAPIIEAANPRLVELHGALLGKLVQVNDTQRLKVRSRLIKGVAEGSSIGTLQESLSQLDNISNSRALLIARTETGMAASAVRFEGMQEYGIEKHEWLNANDSHVRDSHESVGGQVVKVGEKFKNGLRYPHELGAPPSEVCNCRCDAVAVE